MAQTLLTEIQDFCERQMLPVPSVVVSSLDPQVVQLKAILYETGNDVAIRGDWSRLTFEEIHTTLAQEDQGNIFEITAGSINATAFRKIKERTVWDRTDRLPVYHINQDDWALTKATISAMPRYRFRLLRHRFLLTPTPPAGHSLAFEWVSKWWIQDGVTGAIKERFVSDTDSFLVERELLKLGMTWRWRKAKGLDYEEEYNEFEDRLKEMLASDIPRPDISMSGTQKERRPGIFVPEYSWDLS